MGSMSAFGQLGAACGLKPEAKRESPARIRDWRGAAPTGTVLVQAGYLNFPGVG